MNYTEYLESELPQPQHERSEAVVLDLFAGCGGLALGFEVAGLTTIGYELLSDACETYRNNLRTSCHRMSLTSESELPFGAKVIVGGPPCQPFSVIGNQNGKFDGRDGFPAYLSAVKRYQPQVAVFENVRGMRYKNLAYFETIIDHLEDLGYVVDYKLLNAVDYGVPQNRERLFVVAHRGSFEFPIPTHKFERVTAGEALGE